MDEVDEEQPDMKTRRAVYILVFALACSLALAAFPVALILAQSDGTEPRGLCEFVAGSQGLLPLNPNAGGTHPYSCDLNWLRSAFYVVPLAMLLLYPVCRLSEWLLRRD